MPLFGGRLSVSVLVGLSKHNSNQKKRAIIQLKPNQNRKTILSITILKTNLGKKKPGSIINNILIKMVPQLNWVAIN
jgi:hypothetical protein